MCDYAYTDTFNGTETSLPNSIQKVLYKLTLKLWMIIKFHLLKNQLHIIICHSFLRACISSYRVQVCNMVHQRTDGECLLFLSRTQVLKGNQHSTFDIFQFNGHIKKRRSNSCFQYQLRTNLSAKLNLLRMNRIYPLFINLIHQKDVAF